MDIKRFMWVNKEGAVVGGIVGYVVFKFYPKIVNEFFMNQQAVQSIGLIDKVKDFIPVTDFVQFKLMLLFIIIGASLGVLVDMMYKPNR